MADTATTVTMTPNTAKPPRAMPQAKSSDELAAPAAAPFPVAALFCCALKLFDEMRDNAVTRMAIFFMCVTSKSVPQFRQTPCLHEGGGRENPTLKKIYYFLLEMKMKIFWFLKNTLWVNYLQMGGMATHMKGLETGKDKIQKICDALRKETLDPAKQEAAEIVENAHMKAADILKDSERQAAEKLASLEENLAQKKRLFEASLAMACRQGIELLKQKIEDELFRKPLAELVAQEMGRPELIAEIVTACLRMIEEKGIEGDISFSLPQSISPRQLNSLLVARTAEALTSHPIALASFSGGVEIHFKDRRITLELSDRVVRELIARYIRRDFRELVFSV